MTQWKPIVGLTFDPLSFDVYCKSLTWATWRPSFIVVHNTSVPTLAMRPDGFTSQHIQNLVGYYRDKQGWSAGPHLFIDDHQIWVFTPLTTTGRHSPSWNALSIGIEMLGEFQTERFDSGRGAAVHKNTVCAIVSLSGALGLDPDAMKLHKEDPKTTHKTCPGKNVSKQTLIAEVKDGLANHYGVGHRESFPHPE
jgi:hypothetical protein